MIPASDHEEHHLKQLSRSTRSKRNYSNKSSDKLSISDEDDQYDENSISILQDLPYDLLLHILAYLDPQSLLSLSLANRFLHHAATDDATWRRAFAFNFLSLQPTEDSNSSSDILTSRIAGRSSTWKEEFIKRSMYLRRWKKSKAPIITHNPRVATIHRISLDLSTLTNPELTPRRLVSASLIHSCLTRSEPFSGKLAKGYILAPGMTPNDASTLELSNDGRVIWGFASGFVGFTQIAKSALQHGSGAASSWGVRGSGLATHQNTSEEFHFGPVTCLSHPSSIASKYNWASSTFVSGGMDGVVKLWSNEPELRCIWSSDIKYLTNSKGEKLSQVDSVTQVSYDSVTCSIAAGYESGTVIVWSNMPIEACVSEGSIQERIENCPVSYVASNSRKQYLPVSKLLLDTQDLNRINLLVHRKRESFFERHDIINKTIYKYGSGPLAELTCFYLNTDLSISSPLATPVPSRTASTDRNLSDALDIGSHYYVNDQMLKHKRAIVAGDASGRTCIWDWDTKSDEIIHPLKIFDGHHAKITSIALTPLLLITGSADGLVIANDPLTGEYVRSFNQNSSTRHLSRFLATNDATVEDESAFAVNGIVANEFAIVASVGNKIIAWKAGGVKDFKTRGKGWRGSNKSVAQKYQYSSDVRDEIRESLEMEEEEEGDDIIEPTLPEKALSRLDELGLDESETLDC
ncbi:hypothetical protein E3Q18_01796 [Wallemia mellicola]|nr:hypothetical protein E3Q18_01796 [Wallemia mellicola]